jgi:hypothetical protein
MDQNFLFAFLAPFPYNAPSLALLPLKAGE